MFTFDGLKNLATAVSNKLSAWAQKAKSTIFKDKSTEKVSVTVGIFDPRIATYASYLERGWVQYVTRKQSAYFRGILGDNAPMPGSMLILPPRPMFGATSRAYRNKWDKFIADNVRNAHGQQDNERLLNAVGSMIKKDLQTTIASNGTPDERFKTRAPLTMQLLAASAAGHRTDATGGSSRAQALVRTGTMLNSVNYKVTKGAAEAGDTTITRSTGG